MRFEGKKLNKHMIKLHKQPLEIFFKERCSKKFAKVTGKYLCQNLFFNKVIGLRPEA